MAVLGRLLVSSAERLDLPDLLSLDSYAAGDWKFFLKGLVGDSKPFILKGFDVIDPANAIGTQSCSIRVADSIAFYPGSNSGSFFHGLQEGHPLSAPLVPELRKNAVNYVYLTFSTFNTSVDTRAFWDPDKDGGAGGEFTQDINTESVLKVDVNVSTGSFPANTVPVAKITVGPVVITAIEDARDMMFRLGSGGINPNSFNTYNWRSLPATQFARTEPPTQMLAGGVNPFQGADKNILTLKEWMDAVMSKLRELGGTTYWYDDTSSFSIIGGFYDAVATAFKSKGKWVHDTVTPGLLTWTEDIQIKLTSDPRTYIIRQGSKTLADEQVMYLGMVRNQPFNVTDENVSWVNNQLFVNTIGGAVGLFANLSKGDYVKKANDSIDKWVRVEEFYDAVNLGGSTTTAANARSIRLGSVYLGTTGAEKGRYDKGAYLPADVVVSDRNQAAISNVGGQFHWLAVRSDTIENVGNAVTTSLSLAIDQHDGSTARVSATAHGLVDGDRITISGTTNFNGTYTVEVETADIFYINKSGGPFADESGTGRYAVITTVARSTAFGFQEESANHGFKTDDTIEIAGTTNYNGSFLINVRNSTSFNIPMASAAATETVGTARLARVIVRTEGAVAQIIQGQVIDIGGSVADNIRQYVGMASLSQTAPTYAVPVGYNTLDGMANYNGTINENLTARVSKLSSMMADKAQDKMIRGLPSPGITSINNTTNGSAQEITFSPAGASLTFMTPGSDGQCFVALPDSAPGISLLVNQVAYTEIDRNNPTNGTITVANIDEAPVGENIFLIAARLATQEVYLWEGSIIQTGGVPGPGFSFTVANQDRNSKLVRGGVWSWAETGTTPGNIAVSNTGGTANEFVFVPSAHWRGQRFLSTATGNITSAALHLGLATVAPSGTCVAKIYSDSAGLPGTLLGTSNPVNGSAITSTSIPYSAVNFTFPTPINVSNGVHYHLVLDTSGLGGNVNILFEGSNADPYAGGYVVHTNNSGSSWTTLAGEDFKFTVDGGIAGGSFELTWDANAFIQVPGLPENRNRILAGSVEIPNDGDVAYVDINRTGAATANLTVNVAAVSSLTLTTDRVIIARRVGDNVIVGSHSMLLIPDESKMLDAGASNQTLSALGLASEVDPGPLRILQQKGGASKRIIITPIDTVVYDNTTFGNEISGLRMKFAGIQLDLQTGQYYGYGDGTLVGSGALIGSAFTPAAFTSPNLFRWYSINLVADTLNADGTMNVKPLILAGTDGNSSSTAVKAPFSSKKIGQVLVQAPGSGSTINNVVQSNVVQLATGAGGGGSGAAPKLIGGGLFSWNESALTSVAAGLNNIDSFVLEIDTANKLGAQGFTAGSTRNITRVDFAMRKHGSPVFDIRCSIYTNNAGQPGTLLGSSTVRTAASLTTDPNQLETFNFPTPVPVNAGTGYWVVINIQNVVTINSSNNVTLWAFTGDHLPGFTVSNSFDGGANWTPTGGRDYRMQVWGTAPQLSFTSNIFVEQARLNYADNTISTAVSPITLPTTNHVAYIDRLNASSGGPNLTVLTDLITNVKDGQIIIARRDGDNVIVGSTSNRLRLGESAKLFANKSNFTNQDHGMKLISGGIWSATHNENSPANFAIQNTGSGARFGMTSSLDQFAQSWFSTVTGNVNNVTLFLDRFNSPNANVVVDLYTKSGLNPATLLGTSSPVAASSLLTFPGGAVNFAFSTPVPVVNGTEYFFVIRYSSVTSIDVNNYVRIENANADVYAGIIRNSSNGGSSWSSSFIGDIRFSIDGVIPESISLAFSSDAYIQIPGLTKVRNTIPVSASPIILEPSQVAYVNVNRIAGSATNLAILKANEDAVALGDDTVIIARYEPTDDTVVIGSSSTRLRDGESAKLYASRSSFDNQDVNRKLVGGGTWSWGGGEASVLASAVNNGASNVINATNWHGQTFTTGANPVALTSFNTFLRRGGSATPSGNIVARLFATAAGVPTGAALATSVGVPAASIAISPLSTTANFVFATPPTLSPSTMYAVVVDWSGVTFSGEIFSVLQNNTNPYSGGTKIFSSNAGTSWSIDGGLDLEFAVNVESLFSLASNDEAFVDVSGVTRVSNKISAQTIVLPDEDSVAWVEIHRTSQNPNPSLNLLGSISQPGSSSIGQSAQFDGNYIFLPDQTGSVLRVFDTTSGLVQVAAHPYPTSGGGTLPTLVTAIDRVNKVFYGLQFMGGFNHRIVSFDISNPLAITDLGQGASESYSVGFGLALNPANPTTLYSTNGNTIRAHNVTNPAVIPAPFASFNTGSPGGAGKVVFKGTNVITHNSSATPDRIVQVLNSSLVLQDSVIVPFATLGNMTVSGNTLYVPNPFASTTVQVIDITNVTNISLLGTFNTTLDGNQGTVELDGIDPTLMYATSSGTVKDFSIIDISNPTTPVEIASLNSGTEIATSTIYNRRIFQQNNTEDVFRLYEVELLPSLVVNVDSIDDVNFNLDDLFIFARRDGDDVVVGKSFRLINGESKALDAGVSDQLLSVIPASSNADYTGQLRLLASDVSPKRVDVSAVSKLVPDGTEYGIQLKNLLLEFSGAQIDFDTGDIYKEDGVTPLGVNFTPATIAANQYRWYSVTLIPSAVTGTNKITGQLVVIPADADGASASAAPKAAFASTGIKLGQVVVRESSGSIANIAQTDIVQLTATGGAGGEGDANELMERLKARLVNAPFEWAEPNIFLMDEDDKIASATATFDVANTLYKFTAVGQNILSIQSLDAEYLTEEKDVDSVELMAFWNPGAVDSNATYEVSRNGGVNWQTMDMERVGLTTDTFRGIMKFPQDTSWIVLHEWAIANATVFRELNITTLQAIGQKFVIAAGTEEAIQRSVLYINKVGSPVGQTYIQLVRDNGSNAPSTNVSDIIAQAQVLNSSLVAGDNAITLSWGTNAVKAGTYHVVIATDSAYKAGFVAGVHSVRARADATAPIGPFGLTEFNGTVWSQNVAQTMIHRVEGRPLDLRVRITSSAADVELKGYGIFYGRQDQVQTGIKNREVQVFDGTIDNFNEFTIANFLPDPDLLRVYHVQTGQVYLHDNDGFSLDGHKVVFPVDTFDGLGTVTLVFDQLAGTSFDNSDSNAALLAANFLGSTDPSIDRSQNGRGIFLRRPDGTLREITIDNNDQIAIFSV